MHKVVLDTNIFISFLISHKPPISTIINKWKNNEFAICYSPEILKELDQVLKYPKLQKFILKGESELLINAIKILGILVLPTQKIKICRDSKDDVYLETCIEAKCEFLVTGDEDLLSIKTYENIQILTPTDFCKSTP